MLSRSLVKQNVASGLVVFLVALPLCLGIALASNAPPLSGIISGILGGVVVGLLSTSHISVSGPAAGLVAIVLTAIGELGSFSLFLCSVLLAGGFQFLLGMLRAGSITNYIPIAVIEGMLAGIGVLIVVKELPYVFGFSGGEISAIFCGSSNLVVPWNVLIISLVSMAILLGWEKLPKKPWLKAVPAALIAVIVGILLSLFFSLLSPNWQLLPAQLVQLPDLDFDGNWLSALTLPNFAGLTHPVVWTTAVTIAVVASVETLLSIEAADRLDKHRRLTDSNQELRAQGIGNILAGLLGGLPITAVIVRSSANANAGATHKLSAIIHGFLLLICVVAIPEVLNFIPLATLACVLVLVGYKLAQPKTLRHFWQKGIYQFIPFIATMISVVFLDLLKGVGIGLIISILIILHGNMKRAYYLSREELAEADEIVLELAEEVSFLNKAAIKKTLKNIQPHTKITIDARRTSYIATDVLELIEDFANIYAKEHQIRVVLKGFKADYDNLDEQTSFIRVEHRSSF